MMTGPIKYYYYFDGLGSVVAISDDGGQMTERYEYDVFGEPSIYSPSGEPRETSNVNNPYMFTGRNYDTETGLYYYRARYYSPKIGRFLQTDPIGYAGVLNFYSYCGNNPLNWIDPWGLYEIQWGWWDFTPEEKQKILDSFQRVRTHSNKMIGQINQELQSLPQDERYGVLRHQLVQLKGVLVKIRNGIDSNTEVLEIYNTPLGHVMGGRMKTYLFNIFDPELHYNKNVWTSENAGGLDEITLHELSHLYGTEDYIPGDLMEAGVIGTLMRSDFDSNIDYKYELYKIKKGSEL
jgi:RHS repeat-associated protein